MLMGSRNGPISGIALCDTLQVASDIIAALFEELVLLKKNKAAIQ